MPLETPFEVARIRHRSISRILVVAVRRLGRDWLVVPIRGDSRPLWIPHHNLDWIREAKPAEEARALAAVAASETE